MKNVTNNGYFFSCHCTQFLPNGKCIQQGLRGMFMGPITRIDKYWGPPPPPYMSGKESEEPLGWNASWLPCPPSWPGYYLPYRSGFSLRSQSYFLKQNWLHRQIVSFLPIQMTILVLVEFSKNTLAMVMSLREGTFFIGRFNTSLKLSAVSKN